MGIATSRRATRPSSPSIPRSREERRGRPPKKSCLQVPGLRDRYNRTHALSCTCARHSTVEPTSSNVFLNRQEDAKLADKVQEKILVERF